MKKLIVLFVLLNITLFAFSQVGHHSALSDSLAVWEVKKIAHPLSLNNIQIRRLEKVIKASIDEIENIHKSNLNDSSKLLAIKDRRTILKRHLKMILTNEQYDSYILIKKTNRDDFIERQKAKRIEVKPLTVE